MAREQHILAFSDFIRVHSRPFAVQCPDGVSDERHQMFPTEVEGNRTRFPNSFDDNGFGDDPESMRAKTYAFDPEPDSVGSLKRQALDDLQRAWKSIRRLEELSDDPRESKAAGRAVQHVDKAFRELERPER